MLRAYRSCLALILCASPFALSGCAARVVRDRRCRPRSSTAACHPRPLARPLLGRRGAQRHHRLRADAHAGCQAHGGLPQRVRGAAGGRVSRAVERCRRRRVRRRPAGRLDQARRPAEVRGRHRRERRRSDRAVRVPGSGVRSQVLREIWTKYDTADLATPQILAGLFGAESFAELHAAAQADRQVCEPRACSIASPGSIAAAASC